jgi:hypothetical protein
MARDTETPTTGQSAPQVPVTGAQAPAATPPTPAKGHSAPQQGNTNVARRNVNYPIGLRVNITPGMASSLGRIKQQLKAPEGMIARWALMQYLAQHDASYKGE